MASIENALPKGSYAIALVQKSYYALHTGTQHYSRFFIVRVESASKQGEVKTFKTSPKLCATRNDRFTTIFSLPAEHLAAAAALFEAQDVDFVGYMDKEHLRLCLVNKAIRDAA